MACNDASDASTLIAMQSHYHPVVGRSQTKGERRKLAGQERGKHGHVLEKCYIGFCTPTHTNGFKKKKAERINGLDLGYFTTWHGDKSRTNSQTIAAGTINLRPLYKVNKGRCMQG